MIPLRDENSSNRFPVITVLLIAVNTIIYFFSIAGSFDHYIRIVYTFGLIPAELLHGKAVTALPDYMINLGVTQTTLLSIPPIVTMFTSMFLHGDFMHLLGNMWFLWLFGDNVECRMGPFKFFAFYFITGLVAGFAHCIMSGGSVEPSIGASGAISGVIAAYVMLYPYANIQTLWFFFIFPQIIYIRSVIYLGIWFLIQVWSGFSDFGNAGGSGIAFFAHVGGFLAGALLVWAFINPVEEQVPEDTGRRTRYSNTDYHDVWYH